MKKIFLFVFIMAVAYIAVAQETNSLKIKTDEAQFTINKNLYGQFAEHLGRCIYDGIWVGPDSEIENVNGYRKDILEALQALDIPVLRWPGGCFADTYHWKDGVGKINERPKIKNVFWGGTIEDNSFGTHEFLNLCEMLGCDAYISANVGSGTVDEMVDWIEYMTSDDDVEMVQWRRKNGREDAWDVKFVGIGNESWGCGGEMTPERYADLMKTYSSYARMYGGGKFSRVACGANSEDYNWTKVLMEKGARQMDDLSLHYYTIAGEGWGNKSAATGFGEDLYFSGLQKALKMEEIVSRHETIMDVYDKNKRVGLLVDEWGIWTDVEPGTEPGHLFQQNSIRDALIAAITLDIFNHHCERVRMANIAQIVNVLQAMILTEGDKMVLTPTYHVFNMYKVHQNATLVPAILTSEDYQLGEKKIPAISSTVSKDKSGKYHITVSNINPNKEVKLSVDLSGSEIQTIANGAVLTASNINSINSFDAVDAVKPADYRNYKWNKKTELLELVLPSKSIVVLEMQ